MFAPPELKSPIRGIVADNLYVHSGLGSTDYKTTVIVEILRLGTNWDAYRKVCPSSGRTISDFSSERKRQTFCRDTG